MGLDGKKEISLASLLLIVCGIVTMILAFVANSGTNKTNDTMKNLKTYAQAQQSQGQQGYSATWITRALRLSMNGTASQRPTAR